MINNIWEINKIAGLLKLRHDVRACEYEDIRVMWEILNRNESEFGHSSSSKKDNFSGKSDHMNVCTSYFLFVTPNKE